MSVAERDGISVIGPDIIEDAFDSRSSDDETELRQHGREHMASESGLNNICSVETVDTATRQQRILGGLTWS